jgi:hypothetical protein
MSMLTFGWFVHLESLIIWEKFEMLGYLIFHDGGGCKIELIKLAYNLETEVCSTYKSVKFPCMLPYYYLVG